MITGISAQQQAWTPMFLFRANEVGLWYDPSDISTLFQDANAVTPVTADSQTVGFILDKRASKVRGAELNPDGVNGWIGARGATLSIVGSALRVTYGGTVSPYAQKTITTVAGAWYEITTAMLNTDSVVSTSSIRVGTVAGSGDAYTEPLTAGYRTRIAKFRATTTSTILTLLHTNNNDGGYMDFSNISVREFPGFHASNLTSSARPVYRDVGGLRYLDFDGIDDVLQGPDHASLRTGNISVFIGANPRDLKSREDWFSCGNAQSYGTNNYIIGNSGTGLQMLPRLPAIPLQLGPLTADMGAVVTVAINVPGSIIRSRINGVQQADQLGITIGTNDTTGVFLGKSSTTAPSTLTFYGLIVRNAPPTAASTSQVERYLSRKTGIVI